MGKPKHGSNSARAKNCARYKAEARRAINKDRKQKRLAEGKPIKRKKPKTIDMKWDTLIRNLQYEQDPKYEDGNMWLEPRNVNKLVVK